MQTLIWCYVSLRSDLPILWRCIAINCGNYAAVQQFFLTTRRITREANSDEGWFNASPAGPLVHRRPRLLANTLPSLSKLSMSHGLPPPDPSGLAHPASLSDASRALHERAVGDRASLTETERRQILGRPTQEDEDALCHQQTGLTYNEILEKALNAPDNLTHQECHILTRGVESRSLQSFDSVMATRALSLDQRQLV
jgi:hypothetical protein